MVGPESDPGEHDAWVFHGDAERDQREEHQALLYAGEMLVEIVPVETSDVIITSHRVLVYTPGSDGASLQAAHLPNVEGVEVRTEGSSERARQAIEASVYAVVLLGVGWVIDLKEIIDPVTAPTGIGIGGIISLINTLVSILYMLDDILIVTGVIPLTAAALFGGLYLRGRTRALVIDVAGADSLTIPTTDAEHAVPRIEAAIQKGSNAPTRNRK